jgi:uncharacterized protein (DUF305 family)
MRLRAPLALATVLLATGCTGLADQVGGGPAVPAAPAAATAAAGTFNDADVRFLQQMRAQESEGIALVSEATTRASRDDVKTLAGAIRATQNDELGRITAWLKQWQRPVEAPGSTGKGGKHTAPEAALAGKQGAAFDEAFLTALLAAQRKALPLAKAELAAGKNENATAFAKTVQASRTAEITQLEKLLKG